MSLRHPYSFLFWLGLTARTVGAASLFNFSPPWLDAADNANSLAGLNEPVAGGRGYVGVSADGHLQVGGERLRFWGANLVNAGAFPPYANAEALAGRLAKLGVNIVRYHHMDATWGSRSIWADPQLDRALDPVSQDRMDYLFDQLKRHGIYADINLVVGRPFNPGTELDPSISLITDWKQRAVLGFFDPAQQQLQRDYARDLLTHVNPYTGLSYAQDPAVAFVEVNNENGLVQAWLGGQLDPLPAFYTDQLKARWNAWLTLKYGAQPVLAAAWGVSSTALGPERLANPGFTAGLGGWTLQATGSPSAVAGASVQPDGAGGTPVARIVISSPGQQAWHVQLFQTGVSVTAGAVYTLGYWAKADRARNLAVAVMRNYGDYGSAGLDLSVPLDASWTYHEHVFSPAASDANLRLNFGGLGLLTGTVWVGGVTLKAGGTVGLYADEDLGSASLRPFRRNGEAVGRTLEGRRDWLRFLLQVEEDYWRNLRDYLRNSLGVKALLMGTQQGCSTPNLQALFDAIDSHYYWKHPVFPSVAWDSRDWYVENLAMPDDPAGSAPASIGMQAVLGKPHSVTELNAPYPSAFEADIQLVTAAYAGLQDLDALYPFAFWSDESAATPNLQDYFTLAYNPVKLAAMPAAAAAFRRGDFSPSAGLVAVPMDRAAEVEQLLNASAWSMVSAVTAGEDRRAALLRRVRLLVEGQSAPPGALAPGSSGPYGSDLAAEGGQLRWQTGGVGGLVTGDSPRTQFAAGFLAGRSLAFSAMTVTAVTGLQAGAYAVLSLSSLDGLDLSATARALLTVLGCQRNSGSTYYQYPSTPVAFPPAKGLNVTLRDQRGTGPVQVEGVSATVTLAWPSADTQVYALLADGSRGAPLPVTDAGGQAQVDLGPAWQSLQYEVVVDRPGYSPTPTRSATPALTPTPSRTLTPTPSTTPIPDSLVWEDMESGAAPNAWQAFADPATAAILSVTRVTGTAAAVGAYAHEVRFNSGAAGSWGGGFMINSSYGTKPALGWRDLSGMQALSLWLWTDKAGLKVRPLLAEAGNTATAVAGADGEDWESAGGAWTVLPAQTWVLLTYPLAAFRDKPNWPYSPTSLGNNTMDLSGIAWITLEWDGNQGSDITLRVDDVRLLKDLPTATATPTLTPISSSSPTGTETVMESPTISKSPSPTQTPSASPSPSATETASPGPSPSPSPTFSALPSATATPAQAQDPGGPLRVRRQGFMPQPIHGAVGRLFVDLEGGAAELRWRLYSPAAVLLREQRLPGPFSAGWNSLPVAFAGLPAGLLYSVLEARRGGEASPSQRAKLYVVP